MSKKMTPKEYEDWFKQQKEKTVEKVEKKTEKIIAEKVEEKPKETVEESATDYMKRRNKEKSMEPKETVEEIMRRDRKEAIEAKFKEVCPESAKELENIDNVKSQNNVIVSPNAGTRNKKEIQNQAMEYFKSYESDLSAQSYAQMLSWDLGVAYRTALENYVYPMVSKRILVESSNGRYHLVK